MKNNTLSISSMDFDDLQFRLEESLSDNQLKDNKDKINILKKVPKEILGDWARPPGFKIPKNEYMPSSYFGFWQTKETESFRIIKVSENRTVISFKKTLSQTEEKMSSKENGLNTVSNYTLHGKTVLTV